MPLVNPLINQIRQKTALVIAGNRHILCHAISALSYFNVSLESTTLVITGSGALKQQTHELARQFPWEEMLLVDEDLAFKKIFRFFPNRLIGLRVSSFVKKLLLVRHCNTFLSMRFSDRQSVGIIVSGIYGHPVVRTACSTIQHELFVLVDDGNMTREVASKRLIEANASFKRALEHNSNQIYSGLKGRIRLYSYRLIGRVKDLGSESICFFTHYPDIVGLKNDLIIPINYRIPLNKKRLADTVHFLGLPAIERQIVKSENFAELLRWVAERYEGKILHYFSHPGDTDKEHKFVQKILPGVIWHDNTNPYEEQFKIFEEIPEIVAGFYSSTLFNLAAYEGTQFRIESLEIPSSMIFNPHRRTRVESIYEVAKTRYTNIFWVPFPHSR